MTAYFAGWFEMNNGVAQFKCNLMIHGQYQENTSDNPYSVKTAQLLGSDCYSGLENRDKIDFKLEELKLKFFGFMKDDKTPYELAIKELKLFPNVIYDVTNKDHLRMMEADPVGSLQ